MKKWFAIRVTYNREMKVKRELDSIHIENFLPMKSKIIFRGEKKIKELVPAIHNLIFLHTTKEQLKKRHRELCKKYHPDKGGDIEIFKKMQAEYERLIIKFK